MDSFHSLYLQVCLGVEDMIPVSDDPNEHYANPTVNPSEEQGIVGNGDSTEEGNVVEALIWRRQQPSDVFR